MTSPSERWIAGAAAAPLAVDARWIRAEVVTAEAAARERVAALEAEAAGIEAELDRLRAQALAEGVAAAARAVEAAAAAWDDAQSALRRRCIDAAQAAAAALVGDALAVDGAAAARWVGMALAATRDRPQALVVAPAVAALLGERFGGVEVTTDDDLAPADVVVVTARGKAVWRLGDVIDALGRDIEDALDGVDPNGDNHGG